jgi:hypothetical protein
VQVRDLERHDASEHHDPGPERDHREREERRQHRDHRGDQVDRPVREVSALAKKTIQSAA